MGYVAYNLTEASRDALLEKFPPRFENVVCHHVTVCHDVPAEYPLPENAVLKVIGYALDETGVEALVVEVNGTHLREVGGVYHVTHSLAEGRAKVESNAVIETLGWHELPEPVEFEAVATWNE
jgi:hypothetical protein